MQPQRVSEQVNKPQLRYRTPVEASFQLNRPMTATFVEEPDEEPITSKQEIKKVVAVLENVVVSDRKKVGNMKQEPKKVPDHPERVNEPQIKYSMPIEESSLAREVVRTALKAENPFRKQGVSITQSKDSEDPKPVKNTTLDPAVQTKAADYTEPKSKRNTSIEEQMSIKEMVEKAIEEPIKLSTRESLVSSDVHLPIREIVMAKPIIYPDQATTVAFIEAKRKGGEGEIVMATVTCESDDSMEA